MPLTSFDPAHDGFSFPNNWTLSESEREALRTQMSAALERALALIAPAFPGAFFVLRLAPRLGREITGSLPDGYGLCGGMAFAALGAYREGGGSSLAAKYLERPAAGSELHV